jgi:large subunit ribosomal protein L5
MARLKDIYKKEVAPKLAENLKCGNSHQIPKLKKMVVNMGIGIKDKDVFQRHLDELAAVTGQKPMLRKARKSISNFKLREGMSIGAKVTLRGERMYDFLDRLVSAALPRIRDFRGVPRTGFDGNGNYTLGIRDQTIFPEIDPNHAGEIQGMDISIVTSTRDNDEALMLLDLLGMPFAGK